MVPLLHTFTLEWEVIGVRLHRPRIVQASSTESEAP